MSRSLLIALAGALLAYGCAPATPRGDMEVRPEPSQVRWVEGPTPDVRTLLVAPSRTAQVLESPSGGPVEVSVGAFFSRWETDAGNLDQLGLLVQLEGSTPEHLISLSHELILQIDGVLYVGQPGTTGNSFHLREVPGGRQLSVVIPIGIDVLRDLVSARTVKGLLAQRGAFSFPSEDRQRFAALLSQMPRDGAPLTDLHHGFRVTDQTE